MSKTDNNRARVCAQGDVSGKRQYPHQDLIAARHAEIERRYAARQLWNGQRRISRVAAKRIRDLELYLAWRYGKTLPEGDDAAREDLVILLNHLAQNRRDAYGKVYRSARCWAPRMSPADAGALADMVLRKPRRYGAEKLGEMLGYTREEQAILGTATIRPVGVTDADMKERKKIRDRLAKAEKRAAKPLTRPRGRPKTGVLEPWKPLGLTKPTYYRRRKAGELPDETKNVSPHKKLLIGTTDFKSHAEAALADSRAPKAPRRAHPIAAKGHGEISRPVGVA